MLMICNEENEEIMCLKQGARLFLLCTVLWFSTGCSVIGLSIGHRYDSSRPPATVTEWDDMVTVRQGSQMMILLRDGETVEGTFDGFSQLPVGDYAALYEDMEQSLFITGYVPGFGDTVTCMLKSGVATDALFVGFDFGYMLLSMPVSEEMRKIPLIKIDHVADHIGNRVDGDTLKNYVDWGELPLIRTVCLQTNGGMVAVMPHEVSKVKCVTIARRPYYGKLVGVLIGATVDIVFVRGMLLDDE